jgi:hypothetical protein
MVVKVARGLLGLLGLRARRKVVVIVGFLPSPRPRPGGPFSCRYPPAAGRRLSGTSPSPP